MLAVRGWTWEGASGELEEERDSFFYPAHPALSGRRWKGEPWGIDPGQVTLPFCASISYLQNKCGLNNKQFNQI